MPVCPCPDYRPLNSLILSQPGDDAPVCEDTIRSWSKAGDVEDYDLLDIRKVYLQVHVAPELARFETVL